MELDKANQPVNPSETFVQTPNTEYHVNNQRGTFLVILSLLVLLLVVGVYYLGAQSNNSQTLQVANPSPTASQQVDVVTSPTTTPSITNNVNEWKTHTNTLHKYTVKYPPNFPRSNDIGNGETENSTIFGCDGESYCLPPYYISVMPYPSGTSRDTNIYNSLSNPTIDKIFTLKVGDELDQETTYDIGGKWNFSTRYKRLADETINGEEFLIIENPKWYGGSDRRLFKKKNNKIYMIGSTYPTPEQLNTFKNIYSSFKFTN